MACSLTRITYSVLDNVLVLFLGGFEKLFCTIFILQGQGAITEKLRSLSMHDLTQINQQDDTGGNQFFLLSSHSANPVVRRSQKADSAAEDGTSVNTQTQITRYPHTGVVSCISNNKCYSARFQNPFLWDHFIINFNIN